MYLRKGKYVMKVQKQTSTFIATKINQEECLSVSQNQEYQKDYPKKKNYFLNLK